MLFAGRATLHEVIGEAPITAREARALPEFPGGTRGRQVVPRDAPVFVPLVYATARA